MDIVNAGEASYPTAWDGYQVCVCERGQGTAKRVACPILALCPTSPPALTCPCVPACRPAHCMPLLHPSFPYPHAHTFHTATHAGRRIVRPAQVVPRADFVCQWHAGGTPHP
eukprot:351689-Chlamydomonas_euryale.AAC.5